jgi:Domain of unknown function (DUF4263)
MEENNESKELESFIGRVPHKLYYSKSFKDKFDKDREKRFVYKKFENEENEFFIKEISEIVLGINSSGKRQLKAIYIQDTKSIEKLYIQEFSIINGNPVRSPKSQLFKGRDFESLYLFLKGIKEVELTTKEGYKINDTELTEVILNQAQADKLILENFEVLQEALNNNVTKKDIINFGYRKRQLEIFENLLNDKEYFKQYKEENSITRDEKVWQTFFENNTWILGYGLDYIFNSELDGRKLEQVTSGNNFAANGKRVDGLLKSLGAINSLCFCEIKKDDEPLLKQVKTSYRPEAWQISDELAGSIAQVQRTIQKAIDDISTKTEIKDTEGNLTNEVLYLYNPKAFLLIGNLNEFIVSDKINNVKYSSFEMFRKNLKNIEILTYDELYQRAYYICHKKE